MKKVLFVFAMLFVFMMIPQPAHASTGQATKWWFATHKTTLHDTTQHNTMKQKATVSHISSTSDTYSKENDTSGKWTYNEAAHVFQSAPKYGMKIANGNTITQNIDTTHMSWFSFMKK